MAVGTVSSGVPTQNRAAGRRLTSHLLPPAYRQGGQEGQGESFTDIPGRHQSSSPPRSEGPCPRPGLSHSVPEDPRGGGCWPGPSEHRLRAEACSGQGVTNPRKPRGHGSLRAMPRWQPGGPGNRDAAPPPSAPGGRTGGLPPRHPFPPPAAPREPPAAFLFPPPPPPPAPNPQTPAVPRASLSRPSSPGPAALGRSTGASGHPSSPAPLLLQTRKCRPLRGHPWPPPPPRARRLRSFRGHPCPSPPPPGPQAPVVPPASLPLPSSPGSADSGRSAGIPAPPLLPRVRRLRSFRGHPCPSPPPPSPQAPVVPRASLPRPSSPGSAGPGRSAGAPSPALPLSPPPSPQLPAAPREPPVAPRPALGTQPPTAPWASLSRPPSTPVPQPPATLRELRPPHAPYTCPRRRPMGARRSPRGGRRRRRTRGTCWAAGGVGTGPVAAVWPGGSALRHHQQASLTDTSPVVQTVRTVRGQISGTKDSGLHLIGR
ncbi:uncharacterized protein LOC141938300 [Strix uralensis]|uniref:uncharacterized protein LOC141938300 n=1 Tax=Strix uralensis TaxID=36305 RepID=UPI003DA75CE5